MIADAGYVEALLQRPLSTQEAGYMASLLARADTLIASELPGYVFDGEVTGHVETLTGSGGFDLWLSGRPVLAVASVTVDGDNLDPMVDFEWFRFGDLHRVTGPKIWPRASTIVATYDYGLLYPPADLVTVAAEMVRDVIVNPTGIRQETVGQYSVSYMAGAMGLTGDHRRILNRYRYPVPI